MAEQFVQLENGHNISIDSWPGEDGFTVNAGGQPVTFSKYFGLLSLPDVRVRMDFPELVVEIQVEHAWADVKEGEPIIPHDSRECAVCAGEVWVEIYRGGGPTVSDDPQPPAPAGSGGAAHDPLLDRLAE